MPEVMYAMADPPLRGWGPERVELLYILTIFQQFSEKMHKIKFEKEDRYSTFIKSQITANLYNLHQNANNKLEGSCLQPLVLYLQYNIPET